MRERTETIQNYSILFNYYWSKILQRMQNNYDSRILEVIRYNIITPTGILTVVDHRFKTDDNDSRNKRSRSDADSTL
jgi:hypothetical protein